jgi:hypothetical protein
MKDRCTHCARVLDANRCCPGCLQWAKTPVFPQSTKTRSSSPAALQDGLYRVIGGVLYRLSDDNR